VVFGAPKGATIDPPEISLVFNRAMVPLELAGNEAPAPVKLTPEVKGRWQWVGTNALSFVPDVRLPRATSFTVEVPKGARALGGETLEKAFTMQFSTARPELVRVDVDDDADTYHLGPDTKFTVWLNQPVEVAELKRAMTIAAGEPDKSALIPFDVKPLEADDDRAFVLTPTKKLPLGKDIRVHAAADLRGKEGPLTAEKVGTFEMRTYGAFAVTEVDCNKDTPHGQCSYDSGLSIQLSNSVKVGDFKKAVRVEPKVELRWSSWTPDDEEARYLQVYGAFKPGRRYTITIAAAGLKDVYGQPLAGDFTRKVDTDDLWPTAEIGVSGSFVEPAATTEIPVYVVNAHDVDLVTAPLDEEQIVAMHTRDSSHWTTFSDVSALPNGTARRIGRGAQNTAARHVVKTADVLGKDGRGPLAIGIRYTARPGTRNARAVDRTSILQVTDLAISAKISPEGSLVWVTRLSNGAPVAGAKVNVRWKDGRLPSEYTTDKDGFAKIPSSEFQPKEPYEESSVLIVRNGTDWTFRPVREVLDGWRFGASFSFMEERSFGLVFTDVGLYRPGDTVHVKGIVREPMPRGMKTPAGQRLTLHFEGPDGQAIATVERTLSVYGTFDADFVVPATGRLGTYQVWTELDDSERSTDASTSFEVAEYKAAELKATAETDRPAYIRGDSIACTGRGDYLFGAPMANAEAHLSLTRDSSGFSPPNVDGFAVSDGPYAFDLPDASPGRDVIQSGDETLDAKGTAVTKAVLTMPAQRGPEIVTCEVEVTDLSRQVIAGSTTAIVHPAEFYLALRAGEDIFVAQGDTLNPQVLAVDAKGVKLSGQKVKIDLIQRTWAVAREKTSGGGLHRVSTPVDKVAASCSVTTESKPASCAIKPAAAGYYIVRATAQDARKNPVAASQGLYVTGEATSGWRDADDNHLGLVADKASYAVGQTAKVLVKSPFPSAEALITVERAGVYTLTRQTLRGSMPSIAIPITEELRPNAFVTVLLVRGRSKAPPKDAKGADVGVPAFRFGAVELKLDPETRRLAVKVSPDATDKKPGQELSVGVDVRDRQGKPARAEVTLYAVDEGVLSLIGYQTPDPVPALSASRPLRVATMETRESLARTFNPFAALGLDKGKDGGDGGGTGPNVRRDFRTSAYFHPKLVTDANGHVEARFKLPESLTTYRVMAVVSAEDDRFGVGASYVTTSRPLMARPALPRFLRAGDSIDAGVVVSSKGLAKSTVEVELAAEGVTVKGAAKKSVELEPGQSAEVRFAMEAPRVGTAKLRFFAHGGGQEDRVEVTRRISPPISMEAVALYGDTSTQSVEALGDMSAIRDDTGGLSIAVSSTALVGLAAGVEQLIDYPYGCTEQLASRLVPLLPLRELARDYNFPLPKNVDPMVTDAVGKILAHQRDDGGFGLWGESAESSPWITAYALWSLNQATKRGTKVPAEALEAATKYLTSSMDVVERHQWDRAAIPFMLDVLAERGQPDAGRMSRWFEARKELPVFAQATLLHAMVIGKADRKSIETLVSDLEAVLRLDGPAARVVSNHGDHYATLLDSDTRSTALVLRGLIAARPDHALATKLVYGLLGERKGGTWRTTQETAWVLLALDDYRRTQEKKVPSFSARVFLGQSEIGNHRFEGRSLNQGTTTVGAAQIVAASGAALGFTVDGSGKLFYEARLRYSKKEMPAKPIDRGFFVAKTLRAVRPEELSEVRSMLGVSGATSFTGGDLVLGEIVVVTPSPRTFVVVDDPLPAGFEAIDARLATSSKSLDVDAVESRSEDGADGSDGDDEGGYYPSDFIREVRDDRVLFFVDHMAAGLYRYRYLARATTHGSFVLPPTRAEEMYAPEVFGRTAGASISVVPR